MYEEPTPPGDDKLAELRELVARAIVIADTLHLTDTGIALDRARTSLMPRPSPEDVQRLCDEAERSELRRGEKGAE